MPKFKHLYIDGHPVATVAYERDGQDLRYGVAVCSTRDQFSKAKGRLIAEGRMNKHSKLSVQHSSQEEVAFAFTAGTIVNAPEKFRLEPVESYIPELRYREVTVNIVPL
jgi:hypothetical protein